MTNTNLESLKALYERKKYLEQEVERLTIMLRIVKACNQDSFENNLNSKIEELKKVDDAIKALEKRA